MMNQSRQSRLGGLRNVNAFPPYSALSRILTPAVDPIVHRMARNHTLAVSLSVDLNIHSCWKEVEEEVRLTVTVVDLQLLQERHRSPLV